MSKRVSVAGKHGPPRSRPRAAEPPRSRPTARPAAERPSRDRGSSSRSSRIKPPEPGAVASTSWASAARRQTTADREIGRQRQRAPGQRRAPASPDRDRRKSEHALARRSPLRGRTGASRLHDHLPRLSGRLTARPVPSSPEAKAKGLANEVAEVDNVVSGVTTAFLMPPLRVLNSARFRFDAGHDRLTFQGKPLALRPDTSRAHGHHCAHPSRILSKPDLLAVWLGRGLFAGPCVILDFATETSA